jgi:hypothetical protein
MKCFNFAKLFYEKSFGPVSCAYMRAQFNYKILSEISFRLKKRIPLSSPELPLQLKGYNFEIYLCILQIKTVLP